MPGGNEPLVMGKVVALGEVCGVLPVRGWTAEIFGAIESF
jgi:hypothetical protein